MADEKKVKLKTKVKSPTKISGDIDGPLNEMSKLSIDNPTNGEMKISVKKIDGEIVKDELTITGELSDLQKKLSEQLKLAANATLSELTDGKCKIEFVSEIEIISE